MASRNIPSDSSSEVEAVSAMQKCICDVRAWMREDQLMLNDDKTEFLIVGTRQQLSKVSIQSIKIGQTEVSPVRGTQRQFLENICSEDELISRIFGTFVVKFLACLPLLGFSSPPKNGIISHF